MENRIIFREMLTEIKEAADEAGGVLTRGQVRKILSGIPLEEEHFRLIYDYLAEQNIRVTDCTQTEQEKDGGSAKTEQGKNGGSAKTEQEKDGGSSPFQSETGSQAEQDRDSTSLSFYLEELERIAGQEDEDESRLIERVRGGDEAAKNALIERYLPLVCRMAEDCECDALPSADLIQEGNLGLVCAVQTIGEYDSPAACRVHILNRIRQAMEAAAEDSRTYQKLGAGLVSRVNHLNEAAHNLERDLGHRVSAEELSAYLDMPVEEISSLLKVSGDQISVEGGNQQA